jgi:hypothetical protein
MDIDTLHENNLAGIYAQSERTYHIMISLKLCNIETF